MSRSVVPALDRGLRLITEVLKRGQISTGNAAEFLHVEDRLARDDLKRLHKVGFLSPAGVGRDRYWTLAPPFADAKKLGVVDQASLQLGRQLLSFTQGTRLAERLEDVAAKAWDELPSRSKRHAGRKFRHHTEPPRRYAKRHREILDDILDALVDERRLEITYRNRDRVLDTLLVEPLTLVIYRRGIYLLARYLDKRIRRLPLDWIESAAIGDPFEYPAKNDWDPDRELALCFGIHDDGKRPERVVVRFAARSARWVRVRTWGPEQDFNTLPDGRLELRFRSSGPELARWVLEWGAAAEVVEPKWLRDKVIEELRGALEHYEPKR